MKRSGWIPILVISVASLLSGCQLAPSLLGRVLPSSGASDTARVAGQSASRGTQTSPAPVVTASAPVPGPTSSHRKAVATAGETPPHTPSVEPSTEPRVPGAGGGAPEELPTPASVSADEPLELRQLIASVYESYPLLREVMLERNVADGRQRAAWGEFDTQIKAFAIEMPQGYYQNYRHGMGVTQPTFQGGYLYGGYKVGRGSFQPWYKERQTNQAGEFAIGAGIPLLKDRAIDQRRSDLFQATLERQAVEPVVQAHLLEFVRVASQIYWSWIAAGRTFEAQRDLLRLAQERARQINDRIEAGDLGTIAGINNDQLIAARETKLIEAQRKLEMVAIKLSLFFRTPAGQPIVLGRDRLPRDFPEHARLLDAQIRRDIDFALANRPELVELDLMYDSIGVELAKAENALLPKLDAVVEASQDAGARTTPENVKGPFELEAGLYGEVPLQRREARGKVEAARAKRAQIRAKREFAANQVTAEVQDALSALRAAEARIERARTNAQLAGDTLRLGRSQFDAGDIDLVELNIYEQAATDAQFLLIDAQADFFIGLADYRAALGQDPLQDPLSPP